VNLSADAFNLLSTCLLDRLLLPQQKNPPLACLSLFSSATTNPPSLLPQFLSLCVCILSVSVSCLFLSLSHNLKKFEEPKLRIPSPYRLQSRVATFSRRVQRSAPLHSSLVCCSETTAPWTPGMHCPQILSTWHRPPPTPHLWGPGPSIYPSISSFHPFIHGWFIEWMDEIDGWMWMDGWMNEISFFHFHCSIEEKK